MQGIKNAAFLMAIGFATLTLGAMGWYAYAGVSFDAGMQEDIDKVNEEVQEPTADTVGESPTFIGIARGMVDSLVWMGQLNYKTYGLVINLLGQSAWPIATAIQGVVNFTFGIALLSAWRGFKLMRS